jgi:uncharacterized phage protein (TIGR01671 family)
MREIKFRGKRIDNGEWVYGYYYKGVLEANPICVGDCRIHNVIILDGTYYHVKPETVGQYTELKDIKGKEIYEGDIVKYRCDGYGWNFINCVIGYVKDEASFYAIHTDEYGNSRSYSLLNSHVAFKVIGNISDNPNLLEVAE